jgi:ATP-dependent DNA helicase RecG
MTDLKTLLKQGEGIAVEFKVCQRALSRDVGNKNPVIAHFFQQIGRADELGSGTRKLMKYGKLFGGSDPELIEGDVFRIIVKYPDFDAPQAGQTAVTAQVTAQVNSDHNVFSESVLRHIAEVLGLPAAQVTAQVAVQVARILVSAGGTAKSRKELQEAAQMKHREHFRMAYMEPLIRANWLALTIPDKPTSRLQKYRLTAKGKALLESIKKSSSAKL